MAKMITVFSQAKRLKNVNSQNTYKNEYSQTLQQKAKPYTEKVAELPNKNMQINPRNETDMNLKLNELVDKSKQTLLSIKSVFPFDLFPDTLSVSINQIHLSVKYFLRTKRVFSIAIKDISDVLVETTPWFSTLKIIKKDLDNKSIQMNFLKKEDAIKAKKIIKGLMIGLKEGINFSKVQENTLINKLEKIG